MSDKIAVLEKAAAEAREALSKDPDNADLKKASEEADKALADGKTPPAPERKAATPKAIELRVLTDHAGHKIDDVIQLAPDEAKAAESAGWADSNPRAVAFAKAQKKGN
jgi:hypothetical protein